MRSQEVLTDYFEESGTVPGIEPSTFFLTFIMESLYWKDQKEQFLPCLELSMTCMRTFGLQSAVHCLLYVVGCFLPPPSSE